MSHTIRGSFINMLCVVSLSRHRLLRSIIVVIISRTLVVAEDDNPVNWLWTLWRRRQLPRCHSSLLFDSSLISFPCSLDSRHSPLFSRFKWPQAPFFNTSVILSRAFCTLLGQLSGYQRQPLRQRQALSPHTSRTIVDSATRT